jgi:hypothetical protein
MCRAPFRSEGLPQAGRRPVSAETKVVCAMNNNRNANNLNNNNLNANGNVNNVNVNNLNNN